MSEGPDRRVDVFPLRIKLMLLISVGVFLFGVVNLVVVGRLTYTAVSHEQERRLRFVAGLLARRAERPLLQDDRVELDRLVHECTEIDPDLAYVAVADPGGSLVAHTLGRPVPPWVLGPALRSPSRPPLVVYSAPDGRRFAEVAVPVLEGRLGTVRVALAMAGVQRTLVRVFGVLAAMVLVLLASGLAAARWVARRITAPVDRIVEGLEALRLDGPPVRLDVTTGDELELLARRVEEVTDRLQTLYRQERERERELARVDRLAALGTLAAGLAHELNNPLAGIASAAERIERARDNPARVSRYAGVIREAAARMERLLGRMLGTASPQLGGVEAVALCEVLESAAGLAAPRLKAAGAVLEVSCEERSPVLADRDLLGQALLNLLLNAADAVEGRPERRIRARCRRGRDGWVRLEIEDTGPGVPDEFRERVFDPFFTTKPAGRGTGLGLSTAWRVVREMDGDLRLERGEGGARFVVELPAAEEDEGGADPDRR